MANRLPGLLALVLLAVTAACGEPAVDPRARLSLTEAMGGTDTAGYARATEVRAFSFPEDHGPHPDFRTEWWYLTGNLDAEDGRRIGYQFTLFRNALAPEAPERTSSWATRQVWMGHFALTDVADEDFHAFDRFTRGSLELAGASADPVRVWMEDWWLQGPDPLPADGDGLFPLRLQAAEGEVALELTLEPTKPRVLQGDRGLSQKGPEPGNASYYYAYTRLDSRGSVVLGGDTLRVEGLSWMDREWSTSALGEDQVGWDWFALQLDDGWDLMIYQLRRSDGTAHPLSDGVLIAPDGSRTELSWGEELTLEATGRWRSPMGGAEYPSGWRIRIPGEGWDLRVEPVLRDQELDVAVRYWEGAVDVSGETPRGAVEGRGYVELTGYAGAPPGS